MPTTRRQTAVQEQEDDVVGAENDNGSSTKEKLPVKRQMTKGESKEPQKKKRKTTIQSPKSTGNEGDPSSEPKTSYIHARETGTIERGHIYFFYRLKVQLEEASSIDDVKTFHILLVPRPPEFSVATEHGGETSRREMKPEDATEQLDMAVLSAGADAVPAPASAYASTPTKRFRLITVGKKKLPDPEHGGAGKGRKDIFWATVTKVGDNLDELGKGLGEKVYETKTRGTRHEQPARLVGRGGYAIVNNDPRVPSDFKTHLGYHISHPAEIGDVQTTLGIYKASSFLLQVKNPLAPASLPGQGSGKGADYPPHIMDGVFGKGSKGRESYGLKFAPCGTTELLDYEGSQLLFIAAKDGAEGLEESLGEGRGEALRISEKQESSESIDQVFAELGLDTEIFPEESISQGEWV